MKKSSLSLFLLILFFGISSATSAESSANKPKIVVAKRPGGWLPQSKSVNKTSRAPNPAAPQEKNVFVKKAVGYALGAFGCGTCDGPQATIINRTFEPITIYAQDKESFDQGKASLAVASAQPNETVTVSFDGPDDWRIQIYGDGTQSWIFDSGFLFYPCRDEQSEESKVWQIVDPFAALEVFNGYLDFLVVVGDSEESSALLFPFDLVQVYFTPGTHRVMVLLPSKFKILYSEDMTFLPNEVKKLEFLPPPEEKEK